MLISIGLKSCGLESGAPTYVSRNEPPLVAKVNVPVYELLNALVSTKNFAGLKFWIPLLAVASIQTFVAVLSNPASSPGVLLLVRETRRMMNGLLVADWIFNAPVMFSKSQPVLFVALFKLN